MVGTEYIYIYIYIYLYQFLYIGFFTRILLDSVGFCPHYLYSFWNVAVNKLTLDHHREYILNHYYDIYTY